ncbi:MAG TPA: alcohol dehydrogenase catalytic domain-containing protein [Thermoanaerobaculia bacterium]|nr:alcohol dehydrogenase catalytic domain-containing protein [Thermoanaerobaculia bacterium]
MRLQRIVYLTGPERIELREEPVPEPGEGEIVIRITAATTCGTDVKVFRRGGHPRMLRAPSPFGHEVTGTVLAAGAGVKKWREGDAVIVANSASCGECRPCREERQNLCETLEYLNGAFAEYLRVPRRFADRSTYRKPDSLPSAVAALSEPLACVLHGMEVLAPRAGAEVVIYGAGPIGLLFVRVLVERGNRVVVCDPHSARLEVARAMGSSAVVLAHRDTADLERVRAAAEDGSGFPAVIEATGTATGWEHALGSVRPGGRVLLFGGCAPGTVVPLDTHQLHYSEITVLGAYHHRPATFAGAVELLDRGSLRPELLLSEEHPLAEVETALRRMMHKQIIKAVIRP